MNQSTACVPKAHELPEGFVYIDELIEDCIIDAKYAGTDNFMGRPADGYEQPLVVMSKEVAEGCVKAAEILRKQGYVMKFFDAYRPQRAVDDFCRWGEDLADVRRKPIQYPNLEKARMFDEGYIARKSGHTRAKAVDLTIVDAKTHQELDMGCGFDEPSLRQYASYAGGTSRERYLRSLLREEMELQGFKGSEMEWWHFEFGDCSKLAHLNVSN